MSRRGAQLRHAREGVPGARRRVQPLAPLPARRRSRSRCSPTTTRSSTTRRCRTSPAAWPAGSRRWRSSTTRSSTSRAEERRGGRAVAPRRSTKTTTADPRSSAQLAERMPSTPSGNRTRAPPQPSGGRGVAPAGTRSPPPNAKGAIVMPSQRCTAKTTKGEACRQRTAKGQYCWNHLSPHGACASRGRPSQAPGSACSHRGSCQLTPPSTTLATACHSRGQGRRRVLPADYESTTPSTLRAPTLARADGSTTRAARASCQRRIRAVHAPGRQRRAGLRTTRPILKGEEILVKYGAGYWRYARRKAPSQRGRRIAAAQRLAAMSEAIVISSLTESILTAAKADPEYVRRCEQPAVGSPSCALTMATCSPRRPPDRASDAAPHAPPRRVPRLGDRRALRPRQDPRRCQARFSWDGMATDVERYVATCDACQRNKPSQQLTPGLLMPLPLPERPCQAWTQDAVTGLPKTKRGHDAIQVYVERLCKLKHFAATHKTDGAVELAASFVHTVVRAHGVPESIVSDRDPRFTAHFYAELTKLLGIDALDEHRTPPADGWTVGARDPDAHHRTARVLQRASGRLGRLPRHAGARIQQHHAGVDAALTVRAAVRNEAAPAHRRRAGPDRPEEPAAIDRAERMQAALRFARTHL